MINYAKHDEEFYGVFKLVSGDEVLGKAILTNDEQETLVFISDPVCVQIVTKESEDGKVHRGMGFCKWMQLSDEDFYIFREKDIITVSSMSKEVIFMYEAYISDEDPNSGKDSLKADPDQAIGYVGKIDDARKLFEKIFKSKPSNP